MKERDLQDYLFANPQVLFPGQIIEDKAREFPVDGKRIDLLFKVGGIQFIVELKAVPLQREHIGQVTEYYGRMRGLMREHKFRMILVAPSIPAHWKLFLEEIGIRCVEIVSVPEADGEVRKLQESAREYQSTVEKEKSIAAFLPKDARLTFEDVSLPVSRRSLAISHHILQDSLEVIQRLYPTFTLIPRKMARADSPDYYCGRGPVDPNIAAPIAGGGAWWAYSFGHSEEMPKNDVPNVSVLMQPWGLDLAINAEVNASQMELMQLVRLAPEVFDGLLKSHGDLWLQTWLKFEHRPQFFHWISRARMAPGQWNAGSLITHFQEQEQAFVVDRAAWIEWIVRNRPDLGEKQVEFLRKRSKNLNLAIRLVSPIHEESHFWNHSYSEQVRSIEVEVGRLKPLIEFFVKTT